MLTKTPAIMDSYILGGLAEFTERYLKGADGIMSEQLLIEKCSPTLAGLKTGNMFPVNIEEGQDIIEELRQLNRLLGEKGIRVVILRKTEKKALVYLYRPDYLDRDLRCPAALAAPSLLCYFNFDVFL